MLKSKRSIHKNRRHPFWHLVSFMYIRSTKRDFLQNIPINNPNWPVVSEKCVKNRQYHFDTFRPLFYFLINPKKHRRSRGPPNEHSNQAYSNCPSGFRKEDSKKKTLFWHQKASCLFLCIRSTKNINFTEYPTHK